MREFNKNNAYSREGMVYVQSKTCLQSIVCVLVSVKIKIEEILVIISLNECELLYWCFDQILIQVYYKVERGLC